MRIALLPDMHGNDAGFAAVAEDPSGASPETERAAKSVLSSSRN
jgi:hypothetical protein